ncbi:MAG: PAS domain-containing protein [Burkholderiales bacterium]|jgi:two-component system sensor histidine kinase FlrB|nr:PAS domain-containing protein [Burkholderiales bacterium]
MSEPPIDPRELTQAFSLFSVASEQLARAYADLKRQVADLTRELAVANGELKRQYEEKEALSERLAGLLDALPAGVVVLEAGGRVAQVNPAARELLGEPLLGEDWGQVRGRLAPTSTPDEWETMGGRRVSLSARALPAFGGELLLLNDVTQAHALRVELARHQRLSAMGEVAARLAHQLRTPLATALLYASHLNRGQLDEADRLRFAQKVLERLRHLEHLIQDMLLFVRGEAAGRETLSASHLARDLTQVMEPQMAARGLAFLLRDAAEGAGVLGSRDALASALLSLLENAMQVCRPGDEVRLAVTAAGGEVAFEVRDTGPGIEAGNLERIFEPFFTTRSDGTGLGLAIVRSVAEAHGGRVEVESVPGQGSTFRFVLPAVALN